MFGVTTSGMWIRSVSSIISSSLREVASLSLRKDMKDSPFLLTDRPALVTGAVAGLGFEIGRAFAAAGAAVFVNRRDPEHVSNAVSRLRNGQTKVYPAPFELSRKVAPGMTKVGYGRIFLPWMEGCLRICNRTWRGQPVTDSWHLEYLTILFPRLSTTRSCMKHRPARNSFIYFFLMFPSLKQ